MVDLSSDLVVNLTMNIKEPIRLLLEKLYFPAALKLLYSGIDTMAFLSLPEGRREPTRRDFQSWCGRYFDLGCRDQPTPEELYGARCGLLHRHSGDPGGTLKRACRQIDYVDHGIPPVGYGGASPPGHVLVAVDAMAQAFFDGVDRFLVEIYREPQRGKLVDGRLQRDMLATRRLHRGEPKV